MAMTNGGTRSLSYQIQDATVTVEVGLRGKKVFYNGIQARDLARFEFV